MTLIKDFVKCLKNIWAKNDRLTSVKFKFESLEILTVYNFMKIYIRKYENGDKTNGICTYKKPIKDIIFIKNMKIPETAWMTWYVMIVLIYARILYILFSYRIRC